MFLKVIIPSRIYVKDVGIPIEFFVNKKCGNWQYYSDSICNGSTYTDIILTYNICNDIT